MRTAVIGGAGGMGKWLVNHFLEQNHSVIVSDPRQDEIAGVDVTSNNKIAVENADLVLISVPLEDSQHVVREVSSHMREQAILCEITTLKSNLIDDLRSVAAKSIQPLSLHPLFGPGANGLMKKYALIPIVDIEKEKQLANQLFPESRFIIVDAKAHDRIMALTLSLPYFINMILASVLKDEDISLIEQLSGTTFAVQFMLTASIMSHTSKFHSSLHNENPYSSDILKKLLIRSKEVFSSLTSDINEFKKSFHDIKSSLEENLSLEEKYHEMYRVLEVMEKEEGLNS